MTIQTRSARVRSTVISLWRRGRTARAQLGHSSSEQAGKLWWSWWRVTSTDAPKPSSCGTRCRRRPWRYTQHHSVTFAIHFPSEQLLHQHSASTKLRYLNHLIDNMAKWQQFMLWFGESNKIRSVRHWQSTPRKRLHLFAEGRTPEVWKSCYAEWGWTNIKNLSS